VGPQVLRHSLCSTGPHDRAYQVLEPIRAFGSPLLAGLHSMPFTGLQSAFDPLYPAGLQWYWRADFFNEISDAAIDVHLEYGQRLPTGHSTMHLYPIDGAVSRVPADATAFAYRDAAWAGVNFLMDEGQDRVKAAYRGNYHRLAEIKRRYDPGNVFHINQNIEPASEPTP
jgi:FAD/FMN-containing dehydrogenase